MAIKHQKNHLAMRKFPSGRVQEGGRGPWGDGTCPDVTLLPWHGPARLARVPSHLPSPTSKTSSIPKARCKGYTEEALWLRRQARELEGFTNDTLVQRPAKSSVRHLLSHSPATPHQLREKRHRASPSGTSCGTDHWVTRPARSSP